ncbi:hypothetical protein B0H11DRAFT_2239440 [Mycena galericulata]|nr:hypothetical protein B0H11DRAFT_2239440 [Mycena galericulata]
MSSNESASKKEGHRPCDMCRRKKRRCDGGKPCTNCVPLGFDCTYQQHAMKRTSTTISYVRSLEKQIKEMMSLLRESGAAVNSTHSSNAENPPRNPVHEMVTRSIRRLNLPFSTPHSEDLSFIEITDTLQSLSLNNPGDHGFHGKSSQAMLVKAAVDLKSAPRNPNASRVSTPPKPWTAKPWLDSPPPRRSYIFPEYDLMVSLISFYFDNVNVFFPILHRPSFTRAVAADKHVRDDGFAGTLLRVCALGARYSDDPRVHLPTVTMCGTAGWKWFDQICNATAYLAIQFLDRTSGARACWTLVGTGLRLGQDIGVHRSKARAGSITLEEELEKRVYCFFAGGIDPTNTGRSSCASTPLLAAASRHAVDPRLFRLSHQFESFVQKALVRAPSLLFCYSTHSSRTLLGLNPEDWDEDIVIELDSALQTWLDSVPAHLRWDPACPNDLFFDQSATLHCSFYVLQILIHRPFIPAIRRDAGPTSFPSLAICNTAARMCTSVAETQQRRRPNNPLIFGQTAVFTAAIVLLLNIWGSNRTGRARDADLADVHRCMHVLRAQKERWPSAEPLLDTLEQLLKVDHVPTGRQPPLRQEDYDSSWFALRPEEGVAAPNGDLAPQPSTTTGTGAWSTYTSAAPDDLTWATYLCDASETPALAPQIIDGQAPGETQYPEGTVGNGGAFYADMYTDTVAFWSSAPTGFELTRSLSSVSQTSQDTPEPQPTAKVAALPASVSRPAPNPATFYIRSSSRTRGAMVCSPAGTTSTSAQPADKKKTRRKRERLAEPYHTELDIYPLSCDWEKWRHNSFLEVHWTWYDLTMIEFFVRRVAKVAGTIRPLAYVPNVEPCVAFEAAGKYYFLNTAADILERFGGGFDSHDSFLAAFTRDPRIKGAVHQFPNDTEELYAAVCKEQERRAAKDAKTSPSA